MQSVHLQSFQQRGLQDDATMSLFERACHVLQQASSQQERSDADAFLQQFRQSTRPYDVCFKLLKQKDPTVQFHATSAIKEAALREWTLLSFEDRQTMRNELLKFCNDHLLAGQKVPAFVLNEIIYTVVILYKREWPDQKRVVVNGDGSNATIANSSYDEQVKSLVDNILTIVTSFLSHNHSALKDLGFSFCIYILTEFCASKASALGTPWEFHLRCHIGLEANALQKLFILMVQYLEVIISGGDLNSVNEKLLGKCLHVIENVLLWDFDEHINGSEPSTSFLSGHSFKAGEVNSSVLIRPGPRWTEILLRSQFMSILTKCYSVLSDSKYAHRWTEEGVRKAAKVVRKCLIAMVSIHGSVFPREQPEVELQFLAFAGKTLSFIFQHAEAGFQAYVAHVAQIRQQSSSNFELNLPDAISDEIIDTCTLFQRVVTNFKLKKLVSLHATVPFLEHMAKLTALLLHPSVSSTSESTDTWAAECFDSLLESWIEIVIDVDEESRALRSVKGLSGATVHATLEQILEGLFSFYVDYRLGRARKDALEEVDLEEQFSSSSYIQDQLTSIAMLGRTNPARTLQLLSQHINDRTSSLQSLAQQVNSSGALFAGQLPPSVYQEELWWLMHLLGHVLADFNDGEQPVIPDSLMALSKTFSTSPAAQNGQRDPVVGAPDCVFLYVQFENTLLNANYKDELLSPLVAKTVVWFLQRWSATYLMPDECLHSQISTSIWQSLGESTEGSKQTLQFITQKAQINLFQWSEEIELAEETCALIFSMVKSKRVRRVLSSTPAWNSIVAACQHLCLSSGSTALLQVNGQRQNNPGSSGTGAATASLSGKVLRRLVQGVVQAAGDSSDRSIRKTLMGQVLDPVGQRFKNLFQHPYLVHAHSKQMELLEAQQVALLDFIEVSVEILRGVSRASGEQTFKLTFPFLSLHFDSLLFLIRLYGQRVPSLINLILKLFNDIAETEITYMEPPDCRVFLDVCLKLVQTYGQVNQERLIALAQKSQQKDGDMRKSAETRPNVASRKKGYDVAALSKSHENDQYKDLSTLLSLLKHVNSKQSLDFSDDAHKQQAGGASQVMSIEELSLQTVLSGLTMIMPLLSVNLLRYPQICSGYFGLLQDVISSQPIRFAGLGADMRASMLSSMKWAITYHQTDIARDGLNALASLATFHAGSVRSALEKRMQLSAFTPFESDMSSFFKLLLHNLVFSFIDKNLLEEMADTMLALLVSLQAEDAYRVAATNVLPGTSQYMTIAGALVGELEGKLAPRRNHQLSQTQAVLEGGLLNLVSSNGLKLETNRSNREKFRSNVKEFVSSVRSLISLK